MAGFCDALGHLLPTYPPPCFASKPNRHQPALSCPCVAWRGSLGGVPACGVTRGVTRSSGEQQNQLADFAPLGNASSLRDQQALFGHCRQTNSVICQCRRHGLVAGCCPLQAKCAAKRRQDRGRGLPRSQSRRPKGPKFAVWLTRSANR